jgi:ubiquinone/menaquinone biosynthesis C-methylase UbiE
MTTTNESLHQSFRSDEDSPDVKAIVAWLDGVDAHPLIAAVKRAMLDECPVGAGDSVLDVGCGLGHEVARLASRVGAPGRVVGIDASAPLIAEARRRAAGAPFPITFEVGDAHQLDFLDDTFDLCRTERVLRYVEQPEVAVREMVRVARTGGYVVAFDFDSDQTVVDAPDHALTRRVAEALDAAVPNPWIGRQLFGLFCRAGLVDVRVLAQPAVLTGASGFALYRQSNQGTISRAVQGGHLTPSDEAVWWADLEHAAQTGTFCSVNLGFIVTGQKK